MDELLFEVKKDPLVELRRRIDESKIDQAIVGK